MKTKSFRWLFTGWSLIAFYAVCGLLLLLWPNLALTIANYALAVSLCVIGLVLVIGYIRGETLEGMLDYGLAKGLVILLIGVVLVINSDFLINLLPFLWGMAMLAGGFGKVQMSLDLKRLGRSRWWLLLVAALISFLLGIFSITKPAFLAEIVTELVGISLLAEAAMDIAALWTLKYELKHLKEESHT